jgi:predicted RNase H-like nuclease (RuvC/YqgF family)
LQPDSEFNAKVTDLLTTQINLTLGTNPRERYHLMNIKELSAKIDQKLRELDVKIDSTQKTLAQSPHLDTELKAELMHLEQLKAKLNQSRDIAWRAHELQSGNDLKRVRKLNYFGIFLIGISVFGLGAIIVRRDI